MPRSPNERCFPVPDAIRIERNDLVRRASDVQMDPGDVQPQLHKQSWWMPLDNAPNSNPESPAHRLPFQLAELSPVVQPSNSNAGQSGSTFSAYARDHL